MLILVHQVRILRKGGHLVWIAHVIKLLRQVCPTIVRHIRSYWHLHLWHKLEIWGLLGPLLWHLWLLLWFLLLHLLWNLLL